LYRLKESIHIAAPIDRCFLLSTSIPLVAQTLAMTPRQGKTTGLVVKGDRIIWRGWKFGLPQMHETIITEYNRPEFFQDTMGRGRFRHFQHDHHLRDVGGQTLAYDIIRFSMPLGPLGRFVASKLIVPHVLKLANERLHLLKRVAEGDDWQRYLEGVAPPEPGISSLGK
jgi:ligand-binding SRPBCC domain-containing protein